MAEQVKPVGQVAVAVRELFETIDKTLAVLDTLEKQLGPILNTLHIELAIEEDMKEKEIVPLASDLRKGYRSLQAILNRLSRVSDRIEL